MSKAKMEIVTINEVIPKFLSESRLRNKPDSYAFYKTYLGYISKYIGDIEINKLTRDNITEMLAMKRKESPNISNATLNKFITVIKLLYHYITGEKLQYRKLKEKKPEIEVVEKKYVDKIFEYLKKNIHEKYSFRNYLYYKILLETGLRLNEANHIMLKNINFKFNTIYVDVTKSGESRIVPFSEETSKLIQNFIFLYCQDKEYLFFDFSTGNRLSTSAVETFTTRLKDKLKIPKSFSPHKWRHTFATRYVRGGGKTEILRMILGHSKLEITQRYVHLNIDDILNDYSRVNSIKPNSVC